MTKDHHLGGADSTIGTWVPDVWETLVTKFNLRSVIDVGCGLGANPNWFFKRGLYVIGVEGHEPYIKATQMRRDRLVQHDYTTGPFVPDMAFDLGWSSEVVEHIDERFIGNFMATFRKCKYVCITFATPGQGGYHHVNENTTDYWLAKFEEYGFRHLPAETEWMRATGPNTSYGRRTLTFLENTTAVVPAAREEGRYEYPLTKESVVLDCGGYHGDFARFTAQKYHCRILTFEPVSRFHKLIRDLQIPGMRLYNFGLSNKAGQAEFGIQNDSSGMYVAGTEKETVQLIDVASIFSDFADRVDVMKINIEGGEYAVLERMLECDLVKRVNNFQIQWHNYGLEDGPESWTERRRRIIGRLLDTHRITWETPPIWENYERKT